MEERGGERRRGRLWSIRFLLGEVWDSLLEVYESFESYAHMTGMWEIARRYAVTNSFDGVLTMLGVVVGAYAAGTPDPRLVVSAGTGGAVAIGISAMVGTYMTERAERLHQLREMEAAVMMDLDRSLVAKAMRLSAVVIGLVAGAAPMAASMLAVVPFAAAEAGILELGYAFPLSFGLTLSGLFMIGVYLGKISGAGRLLYGALEMLVGLMVMAIVMFLGGRI